MAINLRDRLTFLFNGGRGIGTDQLEGQIDRSQLAADVGMPTYLAGSPTYDQANNRLVVTGYPEAHISSMWFLILPAVLGRKPDTLRLQVGTSEEDLTDLRNNVVNASMLTPRAIIAILRYAGSFRLTEELPPRPKDYVTRVAVSADKVLSSAEIVAGGASAIDSTDLTSPTWTGKSYVFIGVPDDTPDISSIAILPGNFNQISSFSRIAGTINDPSGVPYKWWVSFDALNAPGGDSFRVE